MDKGKIYLVPTFIDIDNQQEVLPKIIKEKIKTINVFFAENIRSARRHIRKIDPKKNIDSISFYEYGKYNNVKLDEDLLPNIINGKDVGIISEAGTPCIADPGAKIVEYAHSLNFDVIPLVGPSSIFLALMGSGMNGQNFSFTGYLPIEKNKRILKIKLLESIAKKTGQTQIFMETPYRNNQILDLLLKKCNNETKLCVATNITCKNQYIKTKTIREWKNIKPDIHKKPTIFLIS